MGPRESPTPMLPSKHSQGPAPDIPTPMLPERRPGTIRLIPTLAVIGALWGAQVVVIPLVLSILISYALEPFVARLGPLHIARSFAVPLLLVALLSLIGFGIYGLRSEAVLF